MAFKRLLPIVAFVVFCLPSLAHAYHNIAGLTPVCQWRTGTGPYQFHWIAKENATGKWWHVWGNNVNPDSNFGTNCWKGNISAQHLLDAQGNCTKEQYTALINAMTTSDYDGDGTSDFWEISEADGNYTDPAITPENPDPYNTPAYDPDSTTQDNDGDKLSNAEDPDDDDDGIPDRFDSTPSDMENPSVDSDNDGQDDGFEALMGTDPNDAQSFWNPELDNIQINATDGRITSIVPIDPATGQPVEGYDGTNGLGDGNNNGISDWQEVYWGQNPLENSSLTDSDKDGWADKTEIKFGTDPNNAGSHPHDDWQTVDGVPYYDIELPDKDTDGDTIPIPQKTVSENGAVTTSGFEYIQTGLIIKSSLREVSPSTAKCQLEIELTNITGYVDSAPIVNGQKFSTTAVLETGGGVSARFSRPETETTRHRRTAFPHAFQQVEKQRRYSGVVALLPDCRASFGKEFRKWRIKSARNLQSYHMVKRENSWWKSSLEVCEPVTFSTIC